MAIKDFVTSFKAALPGRSKTTSRAKYQYRSLANRGDDFRLLALHSGQIDDELRCSIVHAKFSDKPDYEALSYVWGDASITEPIICDGKELNITVNLADALCSQRRKRGRRLLFADAICIDQSNLVERGQQVRLMADIYWNAQRTIIWLGLDDKSTAATAFDCVSRYSQYATRKWDTGDLLTFDAWIHSPLTSELVDAIVDITTRPWFRRIWIIQEAALAREPVVVCGSAEMSLLDLINFAFILYQTSWNGLATRFTLAPIYHNYCFVWQSFDLPTSWRNNLPFLGGDEQGAPTSVAHPDIIDVLGTTLRHQVTDTRDYIYAMLGHPSFQDRSSGDPLVEPDYTISLEEMCQRLVVACIQKNHDWSMLSLVQHQTAKSLQRRPTWVPSLKIGPPTLSAKYVAGKGQNFDAEVVGGQIRCRGVVLDTRCHLLDAFPSYAAMFKPAGATKFVQIMNTLLQSDVDVEKYKVLGLENKEQILACVLTAAEIPIDDWSAGDRAEKLGRLIEQLKTLIDRKSLVQDGDEIMTGFTKLELDQAWNIISNTFGRRIFKIRDHLWGLAPGIMAEDDICCIVNGARVPFILRPISEREDTYEFVGDCFVLGLMNGQVMDLLKKGKMHEQMFSIV